MDFYDKLKHMAFERYVGKEMDFVVKKIGSTTRVIFKNGYERTFTESWGFLSGAHLSGMLMKDVRERLDKGIYVPKEQNVERDCYNTLLYDPMNIFKNRNKEVWGIDINSCYWRTAYLIGAMSDGVYEQGNKRGTEWKISRNAAIGSLGAGVTESIYEKGKVVSTIRYKRDLNTVRSDIIDHVWDISYRICSLVRDGFCMFLTDCFYVTPDKVEELDGLIRGYGYQTKKERYYFKSITDHYGKVGDKVVWCKFGDEGSKDKSFTFNKNRHATDWES